MAWQIAIILNESEHALIRQMPVWALETPHRRALAQEVWDSTAGFWSPEPAFTLFSAGGAEGPLKILARVLGTVIEHHPRVVRLDLIGIEESDDLNSLMSEMKFEAAGLYEEMLTFRKPLSEVAGVPELVMDAAEWKSEEDMFDSFFSAVQAPDWHGRNFDALDDSIVSCGVNRIDVPYSLKLVNYSEKVNGVLAEEFIRFIRELEQRGCPIHISVRSRV